MGWAAGTGAVGMGGGSPEESGGDGVPTVDGADGGLAAVAEREGHPPAWGLPVRRPRATGGSEGKG